MPDLPFAGLRAPVDEPPAKVWEIADVRNQLIEQSGDQDLEFVRSLCLQQKRTNRLQVGLEIGSQSNRDFISTAVTLPARDVFRASFRDCNGATCLDVRKSPLHFVQQSKVNVLSLQAMVVVEATRIDERHVALPIAGNELLLTYASFLRQFRQSSPDLIQRNDVIGVDGHT